MTTHRTASFRHTPKKAGCLLMTLGFLASTHAIAEESPTYPDAYMKSHPQTQQAFQSAIKPLIRQHKWLTRYGTMSPVGKYEQDGLIYTVLSGCKPHDCSTENYVALVDIRSNVRGALVRQDQRANGNASSTTFSWFGNVDDSARTLILKAYTEAQ